MKNKVSLTIFFALVSTLISLGQNSFKMPAQDWALAIDLAEFKIEKKGYSPDSSMFQLSATNAKTNMNMSIFIEKTTSTGDKNDCREFYWSKSAKSPLKKENVQKYETQDLAIVEHDTKEFNGQVVNFHSLNAYLSKNGYWIDVHISKVAYTKSDKKLFDAIVQSIAIVPVKK